ncbi:MAG: hypothetical protein ACQKBU_09320 [Verrucomicrobiales bacterium]|nr:hypothetical protein [Verrucomicrobiota bacterium JB025]
MMPASLPLIGISPFIAVSSLTYRNLLLASAHSLMPAAKMKSVLTPARLVGASAESQDWCGATKTTRHRCLQVERGGENQAGVSGFDSVRLPSAISISLRVHFAPVVLASGSMSTNTQTTCPARSAFKRPQGLTRQREILQKLVENDLVSLAA